jgi:prepilin-type N-terminal cleavage/methylation domain-containing protein
MNNNRYKNGVTLVEILTVVAIVGILASMVVAIVTRLDNKGKEQLIRNTIGIITDALEQFEDYEYSYNESSTYVGDDFVFKFPLDCNDFTQLGLETTLRDALGATSVEILPADPTKPILHEQEYSGSEALYFFLSKVPACRKTLERIDSSLITDEDEYGNQMTIEIDGRVYPLKRFVAPWLERGKKSRTGRTLRYDYYYEYPPPLSPVEIGIMKRSRRAFPVIISAGPDGEFDTSDDITSR